MHISMNVSYNLTSFFMIFWGEGQAFSSSKFPNSNFAISLHYFKKEVRDEVDFLHADKQQSFLQVDTVIISGHD